MEGGSLQFAIISRCSLACAGASVLVGLSVVKSWVMYIHLTSTGRWFADNAVWTAMATILSVLRIDYARDVHGHKIDVKPEFTGAAAM